jgi:hypothetical protein
LWKACGLYFWLCSLTQSVNLPGSSCSSPNATFTLVDTVMVFKLQSKMHLKYVYTCIKPQNSVLALYTR